MGYVTIKIKSDELGELLRIVSEGKTHAQNCNFKCPNCRHGLGVEINIREGQNLIIFKKERQVEAAAAAVVEEKKPMKRPNVSLKSVRSRTSNISSRYQENDWVVADGADEETVEVEEYEASDFNPFDDESVGLVKVVAKMEQQSDAEVEDDEDVEEDEEEEILKPKIKKGRSGGRKFTSENQKRLKRTRPWECSVCHKTYTEKRVFNRHTKDTPECAKATVVGHCMFCDESFTETKQMTDHLSMKHDYRRTSARCIRCGKIFGSDSEKREHMLQEHFEKTGRRFPCRYCPKIFVRKFTVSTHEKNHPEYTPRIKDENGESIYEDETITGEEEHLDDELIDI